MLLTIQPAAPIVKPKPDGTGYDIRNSCSGHRVQLQIGNVSIAFNDRNEFKAIGDETYPEPVMQFAEYTDYPVRLGGIDCQRGNVAETLMFALAADLGYYVSK